MLFCVSRVAQNGKDQFMHETIQSKSYSLNRFNSIAARMDASGHECVRVCECVECRAQRKQRVHDSMCFVFPILLNPCCCYMTRRHVCVRSCACGVCIAPHSIRFLGNTPLTSVFLFNFFRFVVCWHATLLLMYMIVVIIIITSTYYLCGRSFKCVVHGTTT